MQVDASSPAPLFWAYGIVMFLWGVLLLAIHRTLLARILAVPYFFLLVFTAWYIGWVLNWWMRPI